jgi:membrane protease YdiL (CAAX protease family)
MIKKKIKDFLFFLLEKWVSLVILIAGGSLVVLLNSKLWAIMVFMAVQITFFSREVKSKSAGKELLFWQKFNFGSGRDLWGAFLVRGIVGLVVCFCVLVGIPLGLTIVVLFAVIMEIVILFQGQE